MGDLVTGDGYRARMTCGDCPVQIEGEVDGHALYFRARGGIWSVGIDGPYQYADSGLCDDHMDHDLAWKMVLGAIAEFRNPTQDEDYP